MKHLGLFIAAACLVSGFACAGTDAAAGQVYVPRAERQSESVFTFKGSGKGLVIVDHKTGEVNRYTTKRQKSVQRLSPDAEANARAAWESKQAAQEEYEAKLEEEAASKKEAADGAETAAGDESAEETGEDSADEVEDSEEAPDEDAGDEPEEE